MGIIVYRRYNGSNYKSKMFFIIAAAFIFLIVFIGILILTLKVKLTRRFSLKLYYAGMSLFLVALVIEAWLTFSLDGIWAFVIFGVTGIIGEATYSYLWYIYFKKGFWEYNFQPIFKRFSSKLNFLPWGVGGRIFLLIFEYSGFSYSNPILKSPVGISSWSFACLVFGIIFLILLLVRGTFLEKVDFTKYTHWKYLYFQLPLLISVLATSVYFSFDYLPLFISLALVGFVAEYLYGKILYWTLGERFWIYNFKAHDNGHITFLNILPAGAAGLYFLVVAAVFGII